MKYLVALTILGLGFWTLAFVGSGSALAVSDAINVNLSVNTCNQNTSCESALGETSSNCPTDCTGGGPGGGGGPLIISAVLASSSTSTATITWTTNFSAFSVLSWGKTIDYELGSIAEVTPGTSHSTVLVGLTPGTLYYFKIVAEKEGDASKTASSEGNMFTTLSVAPPPNPPPANPTGFTAVYSAPAGGIELNWVKPSDLDLAAVRIMRQTTFYPTAPDEGLLIYEGLGSSFLDTDVLAGTTYYYTIFARDEAGQYSSGAVDSESVPADDEDEDDEDEEDDDDTENPDDPGPTGGDDDEEEEDADEEESPFEELPPSDEVPPEIGRLSFVFSQAGGSALVFSDGSRLTLNGSLNTSIYTSYGNMPEVLKTIGVSLQHPKDPSKIFSFLLRVNDEKTRYSGVIGPLIDPGEYVATVYLVDHKFARLAKIKGSIYIEAPARAGVASIAKSVPEKVAPIGSAIGVISGVTETIIITTNVKSVYDLYLLIVRFFGAVLGFLGLRRKRKPWGTVYDAVTKRPLDPAYLVVKKDGKEVAEAITDLDGRYGFLLPGGNYEIVAGKTHYSFPSKTLSGKPADELYSNLYYGEQILTGEGDLITRNIPLDPVDFDWNEFVKNKQTLFRLYSRKEKVKSFLFDLLYLVGFAFTLFSTTVSPTPFNFAILSLYGLLFVVQASWRSTFKAVTIRDAKTGEPYSFGIVRVFLANLNQEVKRVVADQFGRFYLLVAPGKYYFTVDAKQPDASYRRVYRSPELDLHKGVLKGDILIDKEATAQGATLAAGLKI